MLVRYAITLLLFVLLLPSCVQAQTGPTNPPTRCTEPDRVPDFPCLIIEFPAGSVTQIASGVARVDIGAGSPGTDATAIHEDVAGEIAGVPDKTTPVAADHLLIEDSAAANAKKDVTIGSLETALEGVIDLADLQGILPAAKIDAAIARMSDLTAHTAATTDVHGIPNTADLATDAELSTHAADVTDVHGIPNTADLITGNSPTITTPNLTLENGAGDPPTTDGRVKYDRTTERLQVGGGAVTHEFVSIGTVADGLFCTYVSATGKMNCTTAGTGGGGSTNVSALVDDVSCPGMGGLHRNSADTGWECGGTAFFTSINLTPQDNGTHGYIPATAGESAWYTGANHNSTGTNDDCFEIRQSPTPGSGVHLSICPDGTIQTPPSSAAAATYEFFESTTTGTGSFLIGVSGDISDVQTNCTASGNPPKIPASCVRQPQFSETVTILEPDLVAGVEPIMPLKHFDAETFPFGVTLLNIIIASSAACTDSVPILERSNNGTAWTTDATMDTVALTGTRVEDAAHASADLDADDYLAVDLTGACDVGFYTITFTYTIDES